MRNNKEKSGCRVTLHLLDAARGQTIKTWRFSDQGHVRIGRAPDADITLADPSISRVHVEIVSKDGKWILRSHGRNGTRIDGELIVESKLQDGMVFQLGGDGPCFKFLSVVDERSERESLVNATLENIDSTVLDFLEIDEHQTEKEVRQIAESDTFRNLRERALEFREDRNMPEPDRQKDVRSDITSDG